MSYEGYYLLLLISFLITLGAQILVKVRFSKYGGIENSQGITGREMARKILDENGLSDVRIIPTRGELTDNYNPMNRTVNLSESTYNSNSIAAVSVAAHECGHAIQHKERYLFLRIRLGMVPILNVTANLSYFAILIGYFAGLLQMFEIGIILESVSVLFNLITLPVEFDASRRGMSNLKKSNMFEKEEISSSRKMLTAAALTYVGAALSAIVSILRLILIMNNSRNRD
jgi:Zn-dependent membrane protease YugP